MRQEYETGSMETEERSMSQDQETGALAMRQKNETGSMGTGDRSMR
jgi:hypothetical protein